MSRKIFYNKYYSKIKTENTKQYLCKHRINNNSLTTISAYTCTHQNFIGEMRKDTKLWTIKSYRDNSIKDSGNNICSYCCAVFNLKILMCIMYIMVYSCKTYYNSEYMPRNEKPKFVLSLHGLTFTMPPRTT